MVSLRRTGNHNGAAAGSDVVLSGIFVDGERIHLAQDQAVGLEEIEDDLLKFKEKESTVSFLCHPKQHLRLEFLSFNYAGEVEVNAGSKVSRHDLYSSSDFNKWTHDSITVVEYWLASPDGHFTVSLNMPRYQVKAFRLDSKEPLADLSLTVKTEFGETLDGGTGTPGLEGVVFNAEGIDRELKRRFHPHRFTLQVVFALLTTWIAYGAIRFLSGFNSVRSLFMDERRLLFWLMLVCSFGVYALWHLSFWPGVASTDSLKIWRAAHIPGMYLGDHPPLNIIFYLYLMQFWDNMAVVPLVQNLLTSLLFASLFFSLYRWGVPLVCVLFFYLLTLLSIPIGMYTSILWKDVPFALLIVILGFRLCDLFFQKRNGMLKVSWQEWIVLSLLTLALIGFRHNGVVYLVALPVLLVCLGIITVRLRFVLACAGFLLVAGGVVAITHSLGSSAFTFLSTQTLTYAKQAGQRLSFEYVIKQGRKYLGALDVNQEQMQWDHVHHTIYWRFNGNFLKSVGWNDVYSYLPLPRSEWQRKMARSAMLLDKESYKPPWVYVSWNPFFMLVPLALLPLLIRWLPMAAVFSGFVLVQVAALVFLDIFNWRYYYFAYMALFFLIPLAIADRTRPRLRLNRS